MPEPIELFDRDPVRWKVEYRSDSDVVRHDGDDVERPLEGSLVDCRLEVTVSERLATSTAAERSIPGGDRAPDTRQHSLARVRRLSSRRQVTSAGGLVYGRVDVEPPHAQVVDRGLNVTAAHRIFMRATAPRRHPSGITAGRQVVSGSCAIG